MEALERKSYLESANNWVENDSDVNCKTLQDTITQFEYQLKNPKNDILKTADLQATIQFLKEELILRAEIEGVKLSEPPSKPSSMQVQSIEPKEYNFDPSPLAPLDLPVIRLSEEERKIALIKILTSHHFKSARDISP